MDRLSDGPADPALEQGDDGDDDEEDLGTPDQITASRLYLLTSTTTIEVANTASGCTRAHIYYPPRFIWKGCRAVTGIAAGGSTSPDGDYHARLKLDPPYRSMLTPGNVNFYGGYLVLEQPCVYASHRAFTGKACQGYRGKNPALQPGAHYRLVGNYVIDTNHHHWAELHGISAIARI